MDWIRPGAGWSSAGSSEQNKCRIKPVVYKDFRKCWVRLAGNGVTCIDSNLGCAKSIDAVADLVKSLDNILRSWTRHTCGCDSYKLVRQTWLHRWCNAKFGASIDGFSDDGDERRPPITVGYSRRNRWGGGLADGGGPGHRRQCWESPATDFCLDSTNVFSNGGVWMRWILTWECIRR